MTLLSASVLQVPLPVVLDTPKVPNLEQEPFLVPVVVTTFNLQDGTFSVNKKRVLLMVNAI